jgi:YfiH family protein
VWPYQGSEAPTLQDGLWRWRDARGGVEVRFTGCGRRFDAPGALRHLEGDGPRGPQAAWLRQVHSASVVEAAPGLCGEADALVTRQPGLALAVATADCVPVLLGADGAVAAVHAGWRGIVAGVVAAAVERLAVDPRRLTAWIGPAIGTCCYEVGPEVATLVAGASREIVATGPAGRPHLDLVAAVAAQLDATGVDEVRTVRACTRCHGDRLWSYRRDGPSTGRNWAFVWRLG